MRYSRKNVSWWIWASLMLTMMGLFAEEAPPENNGEVPPAEEETPPVAVYGSKAVINGRSVGDGYAEGWHIEGNEVKNFAATIMTTSKAGVLIKDASPITRVTIFAGQKTSEPNSGDYTSGNVVFKNSEGGIVAEKDIVISIGSWFADAAVQVTSTTTSVYAEKSPVVVLKGTGENWVYVRGQNGSVAGVGVNNNFGGTPIIGGDTLISTKGTNTTKVIVGGDGNDNIYVRGGSGANGGNGENGVSGANGGNAGGGQNGNNGNSPGGNGGAAETVTLTARDGAPATDYLGGNAIVSGDIDLGEGDNTIIVEGGRGGNGGNGGNGGRGGRGGNGGNGGNGQNGGNRVGGRGGNGGQGSAGGAGGNGGDGGSGGMATINGNITTGSGDDTIILRGGGGGNLGANGVSGANGANGTGGRGGDGGQGGGNGGAQGGRGDNPNNMAGGAGGDGGRGAPDGAAGGNGGNGAIGGNGGNGGFLGVGGNGGQVAIYGNIDLGAGNDTIRMTELSLGSARDGNTEIVGNIEFGTGSNQLIADPYSSSASITGSVKATGGYLTLTKSGGGTDLNLNNQNATDVMKFDTVFLQRGRIVNNLATGNLQITNLYVTGENTSLINNFASGAITNMPEIKTLSLNMSFNEINGTANAPAVFNLAGNAGLNVENLIIGALARITNGHIVTQNLASYQNAVGQGGSYVLDGNLLAFGSPAIRNGDVAIRSGGKLDIVGSLNIGDLSNPTEARLINLNNNNNTLTFTVGDQYSSTLNAQGSITLSGNNKIVVKTLGGDQNKDYIIIKSHGSSLALTADQVSLEGESWLLNYTTKLEADQLLVHTTLKDNVIANNAATPLQGIAKVVDKMLAHDQLRTSQIGEITEIDQSLSVLDSSNSVTSTMNTAMNDIKMMNGSLKNQFSALRLGVNAAAMPSLQATPATRAAAGGTPTITTSALKKAYGENKKDVYVLREWNGFIQMFGGFGQQEAVDFNAGYNFSGVGAIAGLDYLLARELRVGGLIGYSYNRADLKANLGMSEDYVIRLGGYASYTYDKFFYDGAATWGIHLINSNRALNVVGNADGNAQGQRTGFDFTWMNRVGYELDLPLEIKLTPMYSLDFGMLYNPAYTETGNTDLNLSLDSFTNFSLLQNLDVKLGRLFTVSKKLKLLPEIWAGWELEYLNNAGEVATSFAALPQEKWTAAVAKTDAHRFTFGVGMTALVGENVSVFGRWDQKLWGSGFETAFVFGVQVSF